MKQSSAVPSFRVGDLVLVFWPAESSLAAVLLKKYAVGKYSTWRVLWNNRVLNISEREMERIASLPEDV